MYDDALYEYDRSRASHVAALRDGAVLYRLASLSHCGPADVLSGRGPLCSPGKGRWHATNQSASYCANNILVCFAEVLFHMHRRFLRGILESRPHDVIRDAAADHRVLVVFRVTPIEGLVYIDSEGARADIHPRITGTAAVFPDEYYEPFWSVYNKIRELDKRGVFYPSARHAEGYCMCLFRDESNQVRTDFYEMASVTLQLVPEDQQWDQLPKTCLPFRDKLHPTRGFYQFDQPKELSRLTDAGAVCPQDLPSRGFIDFVRHRYRDYPGDAVLPVTD